MFTNEKLNIQIMIDGYNFSKYNRVNYLQNLYLISTLTINKAINYEIPMIVQNTIELLVPLLRKWKINVLKNMPHKEGV